MLPSLSSHSVKHVKGFFLLRLGGGVDVAAVEGASSRAGLRPCDVILRTSDTDVKNARHFHSLFSQLRHQQTILLLVRRGDAAQFVPVHSGGSK